MKKFTGSLQLLSAFVVVLALGATIYFGSWPTKADDTVAPQAVTRFRENFDGVTVPNLPAGWTTAVTGNVPAFVTNSELAETAPNAVFAPGQPVTGSTALVSPSIQITSARANLVFRHRYALENTWDGGVLEISVGDGPFQDILAAGGFFEAGGYSGILNPSTNPLGGRQAWTGANQEGFLLTSVRLPDTTFSRNVRFRWVLGTNDNFGVTGWRIDSVAVVDNPIGVNTAPITIPGVGTAAPYPSSITVAPTSELITGVTVSLENFSHESPDDVDLMLVSPDGRRAVIMSDAGGTTAVSNRTLILTDSAATQLPDNAPLASGIFRPADFEPGDLFPAPAPQSGMSGSAFSVFYGANPTGTWSLYVVDDTTGNAGLIADGWSLDIRTSPFACNYSLSPQFESFPAAGGTSTVDIFMPAGCQWEVFTSSNFVTLNGPLSGFGNGSVSYTVAPNNGAARTAIITFQTGQLPRTFGIQQAAGCPTNISPGQIVAPYAGGSATINVFAASGCTWQPTSTISWITAASGSQTGNGVATFNIARNNARSRRTASVSIGAATVSVTQAGRPATAFDFDGDARTDVSVFRAGTWYLQQSLNGLAVTQFGLEADRLVPADYDGDGRTDIAVFRNGTWFILRSSDAVVTAVTFGLGTDRALAGDLDGDGRSEILIYRAGTWFGLNLFNSALTVRQFGLAADIAVPADYDGDGITDLAVYRNGDWYLQQSANGLAVIRFGLPTDRPVAGDFDADGRNDLAVYRAGEWHILSSFQNYSAFRFGLATDTPVTGDYDGDGRTDAAVYRAGTWFWLRSSNGAFVATNFGLSTDSPVPAAFYVPPSITSLTEE